MTQADPKQELRFVTIADPTMALGLAVRFMLNEASYAKLPFGEWSHVLNGQIERGHYGFVVAANEEARGFVGWALADEALAEAWATAGSPLDSEQCRQGDCVIFNAWIARDAAVHRFMVETVRTFSVDKKTMYWRRPASDGGSRVVRVPVNEFMAGHIARRTGDDDPGAKNGEAIENGEALTLGGHA